MATAPGRPELLRRALLVERASIAWMVVEGSVAIVSGIAAHSVSLVVFGINSVLELIAGIVVYAQLRLEARGDTSSDSEERERKGLWAVGITLWLLCFYVLLHASRSLLLHLAPEKTVAGLVVAVLALVLTPLLAGAKLRLGRAIPSRALVADGKETIACGWLSIVVVIGVGLNASLGWWWADSAAALAMIPFLILEAREAIRLARGKNDEQEGQRQERHA
jgi:divalent metal cation (Fe/Co/Zn/Cd) transporter